MIRYSKEEENWIKKDIADEFYKYPEIFKLNDDEIDLLKELYDDTITSFGKILVHLDYEKVLFDMLFIKLKIWDYSDTYRMLIKILNYVRENEKCFKYLHYIRNLK